MSDRRRRGVVVVALGLALAGIAGSSGADARLAANVRGTALRGPVQPVCREGVPCDEPAAGVLLAFDRGARRVATAHTDVRGRFALRLSPGRYTVRLARPPVVGGLVPVPFTVRVGAVTRLRLEIDTGIR